MDTPDYQFTYFDFSRTYIGFLFKGWDSRSATGILGMCMATLGMVLALEMLRTLQDYLSHCMKANPMSIGRHVATAAPGSSPLLRALMIPPTVDSVRRYKTKLHLVKSFIMMFQMTIGMILMLAVMSYNAWILVTVIFGSGIIYSLFTLMRKNLSQRFKESRELFLEQLQAGTSIEEQD